MQTILEPFVSRRNGLYTVDTEATKALVETSYAESVLAPSAPKISPAPLSKTETEPEV